MADPSHSKPFSEPARSRPTVNKRQFDELEQETVDVAPRRTKRTNSSNTDEESSDDGKGSGGLSECDERDGEEREFAKKSPEKGKKRLNSMVRTYHFVGQFSR